MDPILFKSAIDQIAESKSISHEAVVAALKEAIERAYIKHLGGGDDAIVEATIDEDNGFITLSQKKNVVEEVEDDYLEISPEDAKEDVKDTLEHLEESLDEAKKEQKPEIKHLMALVKEEGKNIKVGGTYALYCPINDLTKLTAMSVKSLLRSRIAEAERVALYDIYKDHIGEMVTGVVEKADDRSVFINIGRTSVELTRHEMIGDESFRTGDTVKVYLQEVKQVGEHAPKAPKGPQIMVTRASEGFLKRLFEEEIHEVYDGTVVIKGIAREAGVRSKVAVMSTNDDVDPTGACIGPGGSRIQRVVSQLGNGSKEKEKIDIIAWSNNPALFIAESLRPAHVIGVKIDDLNAQPYPTATAVVKDDDFSLAIGKKGANARLANKLTGFSIDILEESEAKEEGIEYTSYEELQKSVEEEKKAKEREAYAKKSLSDALKRKENAENAEITAVPMPEMSAEEEEEFAEEAKDLETKPLTQEEPTLEEKTPETVKMEEPAKEPEPVPETPVAPKPVEKPVEVKTTTTLDALERDLEESAKKKDAPTKGKWVKSKRPHQISEKEVARITPAEMPKEAMPIYSQEELDEIAKEEEENAQNEYDDIDLDEYDNDKYYDDN